MQAELAVQESPYAGRLARLLPGLAMAASRGSGVGMQFLVQVVVGALAGPAGVGLLQLFMSWSCILGEVLALGLPSRVMRMASVTWSRGEVDSIRWLLQLAASLILRATLCVVSGMALSLWVYHQLWSQPEQSDTRLVLIFTLLAAPLFALLRLIAETLKATDAPVSAISLENLLTPALVLLWGALCWWLDYPLTAVGLLVAGLAGIALTALGLWQVLQLRLPCAQRPDGGPEPAVKIDSDLAALWGSGVLGIGFLHLPFLVLPWYAGVEEVGLYAVANKLVSVVTTLLMLMAAVFGPAFARAAAAGDRTRLCVLLWRSQWISLAIFIPLALALMAAVAPLAALFNVPAHSLQALLLALAAGQLVNAATGLPGVLLNMSGRAGWELRALIVSLLLAVSAAPVIGELYGAHGLAWLFAAALAVKNLGSCGLAFIHLRRMGNGK